MRTGVLLDFRFHPSFESVVERFQKRRPVQLLLFLSIRGGKRRPGRDERHGGNRRDRFQSSHLIYFCVLCLIDKYVCVCVFKWGKPRERIERKDHLAPRQSNNKSLEKRELLKGERKEGKSVRVCWLFRGLSTPANEKLLRIFHHTRESFLDIPFVKWKCVLCRRE